MSICPLCGRHIHRDSQHCPGCAKLLTRQNSYISPQPYAGFLTSLPYVAPIHGRRIIRYRDTLGVSHSTSLARYFMSLHLGYIPSRKYDVDHIDGDPTNDRISNLQLMLRACNASKGGINATRKVICATCVVCGGSVVKQGAIDNYPKGTIFSCSRKCAGRISHLRKEKTEVELIRNNNAYDSFAPRQTLRLHQDTERLLIDNPSPALLSVLAVLKEYGHDFYPE